MFQIYNIIQRGYFGEYKQTIYTINFYVGITTIFHYSSFFYYFHSYHHHHHYHFSRVILCVILFFNSWFKSFLFEFMFHFCFVFTWVFVCVCVRVCGSVNVLCCVFFLLLCGWWMVNGVYVNDLQCVSFAFYTITMGSWFDFIFFGCCLNIFVYPSHIAVQIGFIFFLLLIAAFVFSFAGFLLSSHHFYSSFFCSFLSIDFVFFLV